MAPYSSSSSSIPSPSPPLHPQPFTTIMECGREGKEDEESQGRSSFKTTPTETSSYKHNTSSEIHDENYQHHPTPPLHLIKPTKSGRKTPPGTENTAATAQKTDDGGVLCDKCRPSSRDKNNISTVPVDNNGVKRQSISSPNGIFKSMFSNLVKKSPRLWSDGVSTAPTTTTTTREEQWRIVAAELSHRLIHTTRKRDEALLEASKVKCSMTELEKKLSKLEVYCQALKSGLDECDKVSASPVSVSVSPRRTIKSVLFRNESVGVGDEDKVVEHFLVSVSEARSTVRFLARSLTMQQRRMGTKVYDRISLLLQPYDVKISLSKNPRGLMIYLEALLSKALFDDFESIGFQKGSANPILNPIHRCEANFASFSRLQGLEWEDVLNKGTKHFSEEFSRFCDRKMSEIVAMLGWNRAWPEPLLQAFFCASKAVWLVHLLANSVHPGLSIFRVDMGSRFDPIYMEDMGRDKAQKLVPGMVRVMVVPGFYVYGNVVKCKVLCRYHNNTDGSDVMEEKGLTLTPSPI